MKKFVFRSNEKDPTSYKMPIIKLVVWVIILFIVFCISNIIPIPFINIANTKAGPIISVISVVTIMVCVRYIGIAVGDILWLKEKREHEEMAKKVIDKSLCSPTKLEEIYALVEKEYINDIVIAMENGTLRLGSTAVTYRGVNGFFDKRYFVGETEYEKIEDFKDALEKIVSDGICYVYSIDDWVLVKNKKKK